jgi:polar amino acid transport system substrate-binding protein
LLSTKKDLQMSTIFRSGPPLRRALLLGAAVAAALAALPVHAQSLAAIKARGTLLVGVQADFPPWGFKNANFEHVGYDIDVAQLMAQDMGVKLSLVDVNAANRVAFLQTGKVDLLAAAVGMYPDRAKAVQFSKPYATLDGVVYGRKTDTIRDSADLTKRKVGVARGSAADVALTKALPDASVMRFEDDAAPVQALFSGQVDALGSTNLIAMVIAKHPSGAQFEQKFTFTRQYNGLASKLGDRELNTWANAFVERHIASGKLNAISVKWTGSALPAMPGELAGVPFVVP